MYKKLYSTHPPLLIHNRMWCYYILVLLDLFIGFCFPLALNCEFIASSDVKLCVTQMTKCFLWIHHSKHIIRKQ